MTFIGYIYKITGTCGRVYIGSTTNFEQRIGKHNSTTNMCSSKLLKKPLQYEIIDTRKYKLIKTLYLVEQFYLDNNNTVNQIRAYSNLFIQRKQRKQYRINNKEKRNEKSKIYRENNREKLNEKGNIYYNKNKVKIVCECGCLIAKFSITRHKKTPKHINLLNQKSIK